MKHAFAIAVTLFAACATTPSDDDVDVVDDDAKADGIARPAGVFSRTEATGDELTELMLLPDRTFIRYAAFGDYRERGTYTFSKSTTSTKRYIRFLDDEGGLVDRYVYTMSGSVVKLRLDSETQAYPMFSVARGQDAWVTAIKTDWFDEAFLDWGAEAFPREGIHPTELPSSVRALYDSVSSTMPPNTFPLIYRFDLHGQRGFELVGDSPRVRLFDAAGKQVASGDGESEFDWEWH